MRPGTPGPTRRATGAPQRRAARALVAGSVSGDRQRLDVFLAERRDSDSKVELPELPDLVLEASVSSMRESLTRGATQDEPNGQWPPRNGDDGDETLARNHGERGGARVLRAAPGCLKELRSSGKTPRQVVIEIGEPGGRPPSGGRPGPHPPASRDHGRPLSGGCAGVCPRQRTTALRASEMPRFLAGVFGTSTTRRSRTGSPGT
jgi:hypothetical protein